METLIRTPAQMDPLSRLTEYFREFPGIGPRQAKRFVYFLMTKNSSYLDTLAKLILEIRKNIRVCSLCFRFYQDGSSKVCPTCSNRNESQLMIVSRDVDFAVIEKSKVYNGYYFILGGVIPILDKEPEKRVRLQELTERIKKGDFKEIILSLNATADGEHTADFIKNYIKEKVFGDITVSILGRGLSTGAELEYSDADTIKNALKNRETI